MFTIVTIFISLAGLSFAANLDWTHNDEASWPGQCHVGQEQSPIDIRPHETLPDRLGAHIRGDLVYRGYSNVQVTARNTGYKVRWATIPGQPAPVLSGGPLRDNYTFAEVHFHWLSEHTINGIKYPLEIHMVHLKHGLTFDEAIQRRDGVAVVGVLAQVTSNNNGAKILDEVLPAMDYILESSPGESSPFTVDLTRLFSPNPQAFYTYHGSLTVPLCPEVVTWIVMDRPTAVSHDHYKNLTRADLRGINNDRAVQPLGQRLVYRSNSVSGACVRAVPSVFGFLAVLLSCFGSKVSSTLLNGMSNLLEVKKRIFGWSQKQGAK